MINKRLFLLDMDGTLYVGNKPIEGSQNFLNLIRELGGKYVFLTNNSSKSVNDYVIKLFDMGFDVKADDFFTSSQATGLYLMDNHLADKIYVLGTRSFKNEMYEMGLDITDEYSPRVNCLTVGYDTELTYQKLIDACRILSNGAAFVATNPDLLCPAPEVYLPDCGSICHMLDTACHVKPLYIGKPRRQMAEYAIQRAGDYTKEQTIIVGDRLYTDIACGINAGISTALVLSGESTMADATQSEFKPDFIFNSIKELGSVLSNE